MLRTESALRLLTLLVPALLLTACSAVLKPSPPNAPTPSVTPPRIPDLPPEARQPKTPALCSPSCSDGLRKRLESLLP
jgi:hypothetical protein